MSPIKKSHPLKFCLLFLFALIMMGCASSELTRFKQSTKTMSDSELLDCYHGINERLKDVDNRIERESQIDNPQRRDLFFQQQYLFGGGAHGLMQKEKWVIKELRRRNIKP